MIIPDGVMLTLYDALDPGATVQAIADNGDWILGNGTVISNIFAKVYYAWYTEMLMLGARLMSVNSTSYDYILAALYLVKDTIVFVAIMCGIMYLVHRKDSREKEEERR